MPLNVNAIRVFTQLGVSVDMFADMQESKQNKKQSKGNELIGRRENFFRVSQNS